MGRILSIDFGSKRTGIAVTDPLQIIATGLTTMHTKDLFDFLTEYFKTEDVDKVIIGMPKSLDGSDTHATPLVKAFMNRYRKLFTIPIETVDETYTSKLAVRALIESGVKKKDRRNNKGLIDEMAATIMLKDYMGHHY